MRGVLQRIALHAKQRPRQTALCDAQSSLDFAALQRQIGHMASNLGGHRIGLLLANGCPWAVLDLAIAERGDTCIPIPTFFSNDQIRHVLSDARPDVVITDQPERLQTLLHLRPERAANLLGRTLSWFANPYRLAGAPLPNAAKLTYTSGTTGTPKAVRLHAAAMERVAIVLSTALQAGREDRTLSLLPLSTLLENIGGLYAPLYSGAQACLPDLAHCGIHGSSGVDVVRLSAALQHFKPSSLILVPQLLKVLTEALGAGAVAPASLRFVAVGGARSAPDLIDRARRAGLPVYEGYGLSETCSVVSLNLPGTDRIGSVGRPLPHTRVRIADDGEVMVAGALFDGYLRDRDAPPREWATGDLGHLDRDGYLYITGRKRSAYATAYGRNVSPEWVEAELLADGGLLQAAVFGEGRPVNVAVVFPRPDLGDAAVEQRLQAVNRRLPDYARVAGWVRASSPFSSANGLASTAGAVRRDAVGAAYRESIEQLYRDEERHAAL